MNNKELIDELQKYINLEKQNKKSISKESLEFLEKSHKLKNYKKYDKKTKSFKKITDK